MPRRPSPPFQDITERPHPLTPRGVARAAVESQAMLYTGPPLLFMLYTLIPAWIAGPPWRAAGVTVLVLVFALLFLGSTGIRAYPPRDRRRWLAASWLIMGLLALLIGPGTLYLVMYMQMLHGMLLPQRWARPTVVLLTAAVIIGGLISDNLVAVVLAAMGMALAIGIGSAIERDILKEQLETVEQRNAVLAVAAERERIGRDLHDILGHSLTTITVSAQLAQRLIDADPEAARAQLAEIERLSRQSLADTRATASGMQQVRVATEVASARSVLAAAGIEPEVPVALPALDEQRAELFGYVVREGVTNVVRHSWATTCTISVEEESVEVRDDGVGIPAGRGRTGLEGLAARVAEAGGALHVGPADEPDGAGPDASDPAAARPGTDPSRPGTRLLATLPVPQPTPTVGGSA